MDSQARPALTAKIDVPDLTVGQLREFLTWVVANGADDDTGVWLTESGEMVGSGLVFEVDCIESDPEVSD